MYPRVAKDRKDTDNSRIPNANKLVDMPIIIEITPSKYKHDAMTPKNSICLHW